MCFDHIVLTPYFARPKLAIAIYHSIEDFVNIPKWLMGLDLNYWFYLGHYTIHAEETVLFAVPCERSGTASA